MTEARVITVSDRVSTGEYEDRGGPIAVEALARFGFEADLAVVPDGEDTVAAAITEAVGAGRGLVVTTGGTGMAPRDLTPEATRSVIEREAPGLAEAIRHVTFGENPHGMLSRGIAGIVGSTLVVNLPGSPRAVEESIDVIGPALRHAVDLLTDRPTAH